MAAFGHGVTPAGCDPITASRADRARRAAHRTAGPLRARRRRQAEADELRARLRAAQEELGRTDAARRQSAGLAEEFRRAMDAAKRDLRAQAGRARRREREARTGERREWEARLERLVARLGGAARECSDLTGRLEEEHLLRQVRRRAGPGRA
jgi:hypothetical protein